ncbi:MAG: PfkB family carbohydrate kinase [Dehalococcoidia bacterium]|nr:PfkB family carbohydrate kinase [Dehalococcoidia bacterium]MDW8008054.1 PfkB family carbohydrate kinase [Chloroflexota bacterium]
MPRFLVVGHLVEDAVPGGYRLGGTAAYAGLLAHRLGWETFVLTAGPSDPPEMAGIHLLRVPALVSTRIRNVYEGGRRRQSVLSRAPELGPELVPPELLGCEAVLLGPVASEVPPAMASLFAGRLLGACAQGWLREVGPDGIVHPRSAHCWDAESVLEHAWAVFVSDEDLAPHEAPAVLEQWSRKVPLVAFTRGEKGAEICYRGQWCRIDAFPARTVDPTGAGDVFAAAFLIAVHEGAQIGEAARFASAAASLVVEAEGVAGVPERRQIEERLAAYPDIVCR